ncbi:hypothetical protein AB0392_37160 [Nonomuraea angiospora]|uniref:hypothetical protein n=1 Tax=Nonomuraea angiospora TaxID=46172 RepID=UPI00344B479C
MTAQPTARLSAAVVATTLLWLPSPALAAETSSTGRSVSRPFYAIAHRVLTTAGASAAVRHGANALEIDACPRTEGGWWADHDCLLPTSKGNTMAAMFEHIARLRRNGATITFVFLDLKAPNWKSSSDRAWRHASMAALRDLARTTLRPAGIRVVYGFHNRDIPGTAWDDVKNVNAGEAISITGRSDIVDGLYEKYGSGIPKRQRILDNGFFTLIATGDCETDAELCSQLRQASRLRDEGKFGRVFGWTTGRTNSGRRAVAQFAGIAAVDGLMYGHNTAYTDHPNAQEALQHLTYWVTTYKGSHHLATNRDTLW